MVNDRVCRECSRLGAEEASAAERCDSLAQAAGRQGNIIHSCSWLVSDSLGARNIPEYLGTGEGEVNSAINPLSEPRPVVTGF